MTTNIDEMTDREREIVAEFERDVLSGRTFRLHAASLRSVRGYQPPTGARYYGAMVEVLAKRLAGQARFCDLFRDIVAKMNPWQYPSETCATMFEVAANAMGEDATWFDTLGAAAPDAGRRSDHVKRYRLADRLYLLDALTDAQKAVGGHTGASAGRGWCAEALMRRERVLVP